MGEHSVKNISDPVRVYKVIMDPKDAKNILKQKSGHTAKKTKTKKMAHHNRICNINSACSTCRIILEISLSACAC